MSANNTEETYKKLYDRDKKSLYAVIIVLISIFILFFVTKDLYSSKMQNEENLNNLNSDFEAISKDKALLDEIKNKLDTDVRLKKDIEKYAGDYREDKILDSIFEKKDGILVRDISMDKGDKLPNGLSMANISINIESKSISSLNSYLEHLTSKTSNVRYVIKSVNFPFLTNSQSLFNASISLGMYYF